MWFQEVQLKPTGANSREGRFQLSIKNNLGVGAVQNKLDGLEVLQHRLNIPPFENVVEGVRAGR